jgi:hypothetical protein
MTDIPIHKRNHPARKQCLCCRRKFTPNPHIGPRQKYCSNKKCQAKRLRLTKRAWLKKEENKKFRKAQQRRWRKSHPGYLKQWRKKHPSSVRRNREDTREAMRRKRAAKMFEKSIELSSQIAMNKGDIYTNLQSTMILMRLKRGCVLSKAWCKGYARKQIQSGPLRLPQGRLYKVSSVP